MIRLFAHALFAIFCSSCFAQTVIQVNSGQTITQANLQSGSFNAQSFTLGSATTFRINSGGTIGLVGTVTTPFNFLGSSIDINAGVTSFDSYFRNVLVTCRNSGTFRAVSVSGSSTVNVQSGSLQLSEIRDTTVLNQSGGFSNNDLAARQSSTINFSGGGALSFASFNSSVMNFSGGSSGFIGAGDSSTINFTGGSTSDPGQFPSVVSSSATINIRGGSIGSLRGLNTARINLFVKSLSVNSMPVPLVPSLAYIVTERGFFPNNQPFFLQCTLERGQSFGLSLAPFNLNPGGFLGFVESTVTLTATLVCDSIDFNNNGSSFDAQDIDAFLSRFSEGPCIPSTATCNDIDFNNDGATFDPRDIEAFFSVFSEGPCL